MATDRSSLGRCPVCGTEIPAGLLLIEYETASGPEAYAECPSCGDPVNPE